MEEILALFDKGMSKEDFYNRQDYILNSYYEKIKGLDYNSKERRNIVRKIRLTRNLIYAKYVRLSNNM